MNGHHVNTVFGTALAILGFAACGSTPAKAPGSNPQDMTPEGHEAAARKEQEEAARHQQQADSVTPTKPAAEHSIRQTHEAQAAQHRDFSEQHAGAAEVARDAGTREAGSK